jgi:acyl-CoA synthetase (NDP forming)/GNAT superfamily N-acetyltransferase
VVLRDGSTARIRQVQGGDGPALLALHDALSPSSTYLRFFTASRNSGGLVVERLLRPPADDHLGLVLLHHEKLVGVASYERLPAAPAEPRSATLPVGVAEVAFAVADEEHGRGVATLLLEHLASRARSGGVGHFVGETLVQNHRMGEVFTEAGFVVTRTARDGSLLYDLDLTPGPALLQALERRDDIAGVASMQRLLQPRSVAVVGASERPHSVGTAVLHNLVEAGFPGAIFPVNRSAALVQGLATWRTVRDLPQGIDLVVAAVPAEQVLAVAADCADLRAGALLVLSAGFADVGAEGAERQRQLLELVATAGIRLVGPNCLGLLNTSRRLAATFAPDLPECGPIGVLTQSGGLGIALLEYLRAAGLGVSTFVSVGNKADVSGNDLLVWWEQDPSTEIAVLYLESFGNPRRFAQLARRLSSRKPVIAIKAGRTDAGARAARSHTAAAATPARSVDALFRQAGVIAVQHMGELLDVVTLLAAQPLPAGNRLAILGNAGGPGILAADAASDLALPIPELHRETQQALRACLPNGATVSNPVDTIAGANGTQFEAGIRCVAADPGIDAVLVIVTPTPLTEPDELVEAVSRAAVVAGKPVVATVIGSAGTTGLLAGGTGQRGVPRYAYPEAAVAALHRAMQYAEFRRRPRGQLVRPTGCDPDAAHKIVEVALQARPEGCWLAPTAASEILRAYGIPVLPGYEVDSATAAREAARRAGLPVALKAVGPELVHKTDVGGVALSLRSAAAVGRRFDEMRDVLGSAMTGALVQPMAPAGVEVVAGITTVPTFGPLLMFGMGGVLTDLFGEQEFRLLPITDLDAEDLVRSGRGARLLTGYRGSAPCDLAALETVLLRLGQLGVDLPEVVELDLNPIRSSSTGAVVVDAKIRIRPAQETLDPYVRRLH